MSQKIVILCDLHQARDEEVPGRGFDLAVRGPDAHGRFTFLTVDLCEECAKPVSDLFAGLKEFGREFTGAIEAPAESAECPVCGATLKNRSSLSAHLRQIHQTSIKAIKKGRVVEKAPEPTESTDAPKFECEACPRAFNAPQGLASHRRIAHNLPPKGKS